MTFTRASTQWVTDFEGILRPVYSGYPAFGGSRVVSNLIYPSADFSGANWTKGGTVTITGTNIANYPTAGGTGVNAVRSANYQGGVACTGTVTLLQARLSGSGTISLILFDGKAAVKQQVTLTSTPTVYYVTQTSGTGSGTYTVPVGYISRESSSGDTATQVTIDYIQMENVTGQSVQTPAEYIPTTTVPVTKCFAYKLDGTAISNATLLGYLSEPASTNKVTCYSALTESIGSELVANGGFDTDTVWTKGTGCTISGGVGSHAAGSASSFSQLGLLVIGRAYTVTFTITSISAGTVTIGVGNATNGTARSTAATFTETLVCTGNTGFYINFSSVAVCSIDNVSVKEVYNAIGTVASSTSTGAIRNMVLSGAATATATIVDDTAALTAAGLQGIVPGMRVVKLNNSGGATDATVTFLGQSGNTNPQTGSVYARITAATGNLNMENMPSPKTNITGSTFSRFILNITPSLAVNQIQIAANAGGVIYFILPQLEELSYATSPMVTQGATATRAATALSVPTAGNFSASIGSAYGEFIPLTIVSNPQIVGNLVLYLTSGTLRVYDGTNLFNTANSFTVGVINKAIGTWGVLGLSACLSGGAVAHSAFDGALLPTTTLTIGDNCTGYIKNVRIYKKALTDAQCIKLTT